MMMMIMLMMMTCVVVIIIIITIITIVVVMMKKPVVDLVLGSWWTNRVLEHPQLVSMSLLTSAIMVPLAAFAPRLHCAA